MNSTLITRKYSIFKGQVRDQYAIWGQVHHDIRDRQIDDLRFNISHLYSMSDTLRRWEGENERFFNGGPFAVETHI